MPPEHEPSEPRLPFTAGKMRAKPVDAPKISEQTLQVSELTDLIDAALRKGLPERVRVIGEISNLSDRTHWYFNLKDAQAVVSCVMFASSARKVQFRPENGHEVVVSGRIEHYAKQGRTQLYVTSMTPVGAGALELEFRRLCEELRAAGYFDPAQKRDIPRFPRRIAVVTSAKGAALQDVLDTLRRRAPFIDVLTVDVRVQGDGASDDIARALDDLSARAQTLAIDTIILTRGGGSIEDLWAFNERPVADAIRRCSVPIVAAIGHETDTTIAELVADERGATPTQAAVRASPDRAALVEQLDRAADRLTIAHQRARKDATSDLETLKRALKTSLQSRLHAQTNRVERGGAALARCRPEAVLARRATRLGIAQKRLALALRRRLDPERVETLARALPRAMQVDLARRRTQVTSVERALRISGPPSVLGRGYSITQRADGQVLLSPDDAPPGERLRTRLREGVVYSVVPSGEPTRRRRPKREDPAQFDLFGED